MYSSVVVCNRGRLHRRTHTSDGSARGAGSLDRAAGCFGRNGTKRQTASQLPLAPRFDFLSHCSQHTYQTSVDTTRIPPTTLQTPTPTPLRCTTSRKRSHGVTGMSGPRPLHLHLPSQANAGRESDRVTALARCATVARDGARSFGRCSYLAEPAKPRSCLFVDYGRVPHALEHLPEDCCTVCHGGDGSGGVEPKTENRKGSADLPRSKSKLSFLFESAATTETIGRYSFVGAGWSSSGAITYSH
jgi:hypothetical protein